VIQSLDAARADGVDRRAVAVARADAGDMQVMGTGALDCPIQCCALCDRHGGEPPIQVAIAHAMRNELSVGLRVAGHDRSMRSREASAGQDRTLQELFLTPVSQRVHLALPRPSIRWKRHESVMNSVMNTALGRGSAMSANVRAMKDASCARSPSQSKLVAHPVGTAVLDMG